MTLWACFLAPLAGAFLGCGFDGAIIIEEVDEVGDGRMLENEGMDKRTRYS